MLYFLWDLGLKVGHATRSIADCLADAQRRRDHPHQPAGRALLAGDAALFADFRPPSTRLRRRRPGRLHRRQAGRARRPPSPLRRKPFMVEPNIKEGRGGLRDLQTLYWMVALRLRHVHA
jgi:[protein-PII] uridylyltransferase